MIGRYVVIAQYGSLDPIGIKAGTKQSMLDYARATFADPDHSAITKIIVSDFQRGVTVLTLTRN